MLTDEQRAVLESLACMSSPYENEILWSILANEKASAIHLDNAAIERARDAWFDNSGSFESRLRAAISAASAAPADEGSISIQEAWEAAGGNPGIKATRDDLLIALQDLDAAVDELSAAPAEGRETSAPTCNIAVDLTRELVRSAWVKRFNYVYDRMAEDAELMGFARAIQLECFKTIATGPTKPADEGRTGRTACCPYCTDPHCGGCLATAPTISEATRDVLDERRRQVEKEGWAPEHDDEHRESEMALAAACYAMAAGGYAKGQTPPIWPWGLSWWKPAYGRRDLIKAGALILAEIERIDRAAAKGESK